MKNNRQEKILAIIEAEPIETQEQLLSKLQEQGIESTQATISRDIKQLHLIKEPVGGGRYRYAVSAQKIKLNFAGRLQVILRESILSADRAQNLVVLNRGRRDGVAEEMALLASDGSMAGYVVDCTERYSVAMSVLNTSFRASGKLVGSDYFGSIYWDGADPHTVVLDELSKYADPQPGQEVVTTGFSQYFPADVLIGWVESAELNETRTAFKVRVRLAAEMSRLTDVILVENRDLTEIRDLQNSEKVEQHTRLN